MRIGMLGAGTVSRAVARQALAHGHQVALAARRGPAALAGLVDELGPGAAAVAAAEAAAAELVLLGVPWTQLEPALTGLPAWDDRILVDATNPFVRTDPLTLADLGGRGSSEIVAGLAPGARLVKAFNSVTMANFDRGPTEGATTVRRVLLVSGDDVAAKTTVAELIEQFGYAAVDLGGLVTGGRLQQAGGPLAGRDLLLRTD